MSFITGVYQEVIAKYHASRYTYHGGVLLVEYDDFNGEVKDGRYITNTHVTVLPDKHKDGATFHVTVETSTAPPKKKVDVMAVSNWRAAAAPAKMPVTEKHYVYYDFCGDRMTRKAYQWEKERDAVAEAIAVDFKKKVDRALGI